MRSRETAIWEPSAPMEYTSHAANAPHFLESGLWYNPAPPRQYGCHAAMRTADGRRVALKRKTVLDSRRSKCRSPGLYNRLSPVFLPMDTVIAEYQKWKQQGHALRAQAKQAMEKRFRDLLTEAAQIAQDYHQDFGAALKPPASITAFRFKAATANGKKGTSKAAAPALAPAVVAPSKPGSQSPLEKKLAQARTKLDAAKAAGKPTRNLEDKVYEIEDEIRLAARA